MLWAPWWLSTPASPICFLHWCAPTLLPVSFPSLYFGDSSAPSGKGTWFHCLTAVTSCCTNPLALQDEAAKKLLLELQRAALQCQHSYQNLISFIMGWFQGYCSAVQTVTSGTAAPLATLCCWVLMIESGQPSESTAACQEAFFHQSSYSRTAFWPYYFPAQFPVI